MYADCVISGQKKGKTAKKCDTIQNREATSEKKSVDRDKDRHMAFPDGPLNIEEHQVTTKTESVGDDDTNEDIGGSVEDSTPGAIKSISSLKRKFKEMEKNFASLRRSRVARLKKKTEQINRLID